MVTKAIVEEIISEYKVKVRIPIYDKAKEDLTATSSKDLSIATMCTLPSSSNGVKTGDIVFVSFEDYDRSKPVIVGHLYAEANKGSFANLQLNSLIVNNNCTLPKSTRIGEVKYNDLLQLISTNGDLQKQINDLTIKLDSQQELLETLSLKVNMLETALLNDYEGTDISESPSIQDIYDNDISNTMILKGDINNG